MDEKLIKSSLQKLIKWLDKNGWEGLDPYTLREALFKKTIYQKFQKRRIFRYICHQSIEIIPEYLSLVLKPKPQINAKGLGLIAHAYLNLYELTNDEDYLKHADSIFQWLIKNTNNNYPGISWGYPFDWHTDVLIPAQTPSSVVTVTIGYAFLKRYLLKRENRYLSILVGIKDFLLNGLNIVYSNENELCYSYTPLDNKHVLNANLFVADYLARLSSLTSNNEIQSIAKKIYRYTVNRQNSDGSFYYYGSEQPSNPYVAKLLKTIDHYHTGFVLRTMNSIYWTLKLKESSTPIESGVNYYLNNLFDDFIPKFMPHKKYPINIHSISEALLTLNEFSNHNKAKEKLEKLLPCAIQKFQDRTGYFYYSIWPFRKVKIAYHRWGQAWMFFALTELLKNRDYS